tara:strand:- start:4090 stop:5115 length:1026 start_codon:yes stop_codon:yes gene_type:complete
MSKFPWKKQKAGFEESLIYLKGRKEGLIKSIKTPWEKFNDATTAGIEWHSMTVIGGRPGSGKTLMKDQFIKEAFPLNPAENFRVLEFQLEMLARTSAIRSYSSELGVSYKYLCSAEGLLSNEDLQKCFEYAKKRVKYPIDIVETPPTVEELKVIIDEYMDNNSTYIDKVIKDENDNEKSIKIKEFTKTIITIDHSILIKSSKHHKSKQDTLYELGETLTALKKKYPIAFIVLSQLNRSIDKPERQEDGKYGNYVLESDIFGADALLQHADLVVGLNRPGKQKIRFYGPDGYIIENDKVLVMHFLKCRNGDVRMSFFNAAFEKMSIEEMNTPPQRQRRSNTI